MAIFGGNKGQQPQNSSTRANPSESASQGERGTGYVHTPVEHVISEGDVSQGIPAGGTDHENS